MIINLAWELRTTDSYRGTGCVSNQKRPGLFFHCWSNAFDVPIEFNFDNGRYGDIVKMPSFLQTIVGKCDKWSVL